MTKHRPQNFKAWLGKGLKYIVITMLTRLMQVAVVRSCGGNQAAEMAGGAAITVTPLSPFRMAQMWLITVNVTSSLDTALKTSKNIHRLILTFDILQR